MSITDFFKKAPTSTNSDTKKRNKKRKLDDMEDQPSKSLSDDADDDSQPKRKRMKVKAVDDTQKESDIDESSTIEDSTVPESKENTENQENEEPQTVDLSTISYANCHKLLPSSWKKVLKNEFKKSYFKQLFRKLAMEEKRETEIFPPAHMVFRAFELCPWDQLKVVILGQDPYHDDGQAEGICFSVQKGIKIPPSLRNMYKEAATDVGLEHPGHGSLIQWGKQGILLLNTVLTVEAHKANSHKKFGWTQFTDAVIHAISRQHKDVVFVLWGNQAKKKKDMINTSKHKIVSSAHPSPLSASRGFFGSKPYSKCNKLLKAMGKTEIDWQIKPESESEDE